MNYVHTLSYNPAKMSMNERLRIARENAGHKSARGAALSKGWSVSTYIAHENGQNNFDDATASKYAQAFSVTAEFLKFGPKPQSPGIDDQLRGLDKSASEKLIAEFNLMIRAVKIVGKIE